MTRGLGYRIPTEDKRDYKLDRLLASVTATPSGHADNSWQTVEVLDQGQLGSCVLNAILELVRADQVKREPASKPPLGSRLAGYYFTRARSGEESIDTGCDPREAMKALGVHGICKESIWPYDINSFARCPSAIALRDSYDQKTYEYYWITATGTVKVDQVKLAIDNGYQVFIAGDIGHDYCAWKVGDAPLGPPNVSIGGHARVIEGYDLDVFEELGSWGREFGDEGRVLISADYIESPKTSSLLVIRKAPVIPQ